MELVEADASVLKRLHEVSLRGLERLANALVLCDDMRFDHAFGLLDDELDLAQVEGVHVDRDRASGSRRGKRLDPIGMDQLGSRGGANAANGLGGFWVGEGLVCASTRRELKLVPPGFRL